MVKRSLLNASMFSLCVAFIVPTVASEIPKCCRAIVSSVDGPNRGARRAISLDDTYEAEKENKLESKFQRTNVLSIGHNMVGIADTKPRNRTRFVDDLPRQLQQLSVWTLSPLC